MHPIPPSPSHPSLPHPPPPDSKCPLTLASFPSHSLGNCPHLRRTKVSWLDRCPNPSSSIKFLSSQLYAIRDSDRKLPDNDLDHHHPLLPPRHRQILNLIKTYGKEKNLPELRRIHAGILEETSKAIDAYVATALIRSYAACGALRAARDVFEQLPTRNAVSWTALIGGYAENKLYEEALECFKEMQSQEVCPDAVTYACVLTICANVGLLDVGEGIAAEIRKRGLLQGDIVLGNALVNMYAKCGVFTKAKEVFGKISTRNVVTWNAMIAGYTQHDLGDEALECFQNMQEERVCPNSVTYICVLKACSIVRSIDIGQNIYSKVKMKGLLKRDIALGTALIEMYVKCHALEKAREVFDHLIVRDIVSWNVLIAGYIQHELCDNALKCFKQMQDEGVFPDVITYTSILKGCSSAGNLEMGEEIDVRFRNQELFKKDRMFGNALIDMYAKSGALEKAQEVFELLPVQDTVSWNTMITGYVLHGFGDKALKCFRQMQGEGICPNTVTYICVLKACGIVRSLENGEDIVVEIRKQGLMEKDTVLHTTLVDMYSKCGALEKAQHIFDKLQARDVIAWNSLISGYILNGLGNEALKCFKQMQEEAVCPDVVTYACILKACGILGSVEIGRYTDSRVRSQGILQEDVVLCNALIDMYAKCGELAEALEVFKQLPVQDVVAWTALIVGYVQRGFYDEALKCFRQMQDEGVCADAVTYACLLKACGDIGSLDIGEEIVATVKNQELMLENNMIGHILVDMYAKCGALKKAHKAFEQLLVPDVVSWNAIIAAYAQLGDGNAVLQLFRKMETDCVAPNSGTFASLLTAFSHAGLLKEGEKLLDEMHLIYGLPPTVEHFTCMIHLFGRAGHFEKAITLLDKLPSSDHISLFLAILGACHKWMNVEVGEWVFEQSLQLDVRSASAYVFMGNIYAAAEQREMISFERKSD